MTQRVPISVKSTKVAPKPAVSPSQMQVIPYEWVGVAFPFAEPLLNSEILEAKKRDLPQSLFEYRIIVRAPREVQEVYQAQISQLMYLPLVFSLPLGRIAGDITNPLHISPQQVRHGGKILTAYLRKKFAPSVREKVKVVPEIAGARPGEDFGKERGGYVRTKNTFVKYAVYLQIESGGISGAEPFNPLITPEDDLDPLAVRGDRFNVPFGAFNEAGSEKIRGAPLMTPYYVSPAEFLAFQTLPWREFAINNDYVVLTDNPLFLLWCKQEAIRRQQQEEIAFVPFPEEAERSTERKVIDLLVLRDETKDDEDEEKKTVLVERKSLSSAPADSFPTLSRNFAKNILEEMILWDNSLFLLPRDYPQLASLQQELRGGIARLRESGVSVLLLPEKNGPNGSEGIIYEAKVLDLLERFRLPSERIGNFLYVRDSEGFTVVLGKSAFDPFERIIRNEPLESWVTRSLAAEARGAPTTLLLDGCNNRGFSSLSSSRSSLPFSSSSSLPSSSLPSSSSPPSSSSLPSSSSSHLPSSSSPSPRSSPRFRESPPVSPPPLEPATPRTYAASRAVIPHSEVNTPLLLAVEKSYQAVFASNSQLPVHFAKYLRVIDDGTLVQVPCQTLKDVEIFLRNLLAA